MKLRFAWTCVLLSVALCLTVGCHRSDKLRSDREAARHMNRMERQTARDVISFDSGGRVMRLARAGATVTIGLEARAADVGVPFYPGALPIGSQHTMKESAGNEDRYEHITRLKSDAPLEKVFEFYKKHFGSGVAVKDLRPLGRKRVTVEESRPGFDAAVTVEESDRGVEILIMSRKVAPNAKTRR